MNKLEITEAANGFIITYQSGNQYIYDSLEKLLDAVENQFSFKNTTTGTCVKSNTA